MGLNFHDLDSDPWIRRVQYRIWVQTDPTYSEMFDGFWIVFRLQELFSLMNDNNLYN